MATFVLTDHCGSGESLLVPWEPMQTPLLTNNDDKFCLSGTCGDCMKCDTCKLLFVDSDEDDEVFDAILKQLCAQAPRRIDALHRDLDLPNAKRVKLSDQAQPEVKSDEELGLESLLREPIIELDDVSLAFKIAEATQEVHRNLRCERVKPFSSESITNLAERFIAQCQMFESTGRDCTVTIGYHYTRQWHLDSISQHGLLSEAERAAKNVGERKQIGWFGDGIYTANNPHAFAGGYGPIGLIVAIVKGNTGRILNRNESWMKTLDTGIGNKARKRCLNGLEPLFDDEIILKTSSQVLPLASFPSSMVRRSRREAWKDVLWQYHVNLQEMLDDFFHFGVKTKIERIETPVKPRQMKGALLQSTNLAAHVRTTMTQDVTVGSQTKAAATDPFFALGPQAYLKPLPLSDSDNTGNQNLAQILRVSQDLLDLCKQLRLKSTEQQNYQGSAKCIPDRPPPTE